MRYTPRLPKTNVNVSPGSPLRDLALMLGVLIVLLVGLYAGLGLAVDHVAAHVSWDTEQRLMRMLGEHPMVRSARPAPPFLSRLAEEVRTRATDIPHPMRVLVRRDASLNAFALPGGDLVLTSGLLESVESENELVFILGHELGHVARRDHLRALGRGLVLLALSSLVLDADSSPASALGGMIRLTEAGFSRRQETLADETGQDALFALYGHVGGGGEVLEKLSGGERGSWIARLGADHPDTLARVRHLRERAQAKGYPEGGRPVPLGGGLRVQAAPRPAADPAFPA